MNVIVAFEQSGVVRDAFRSQGHAAWSCDLAYSDSDYHIEADAFSYLSKDPEYWDLLIAHPPCTFLCSSGLHWNKRVPGRDKQTELALQQVRWLMELNIDHICIENPVGRIGTEITQASQYIQPYEFGHDASKKTGLWLKNLPLLKPTKRIKGRMVDGVERWANQTDSGQNKLPPSEVRWLERSRTYEGIAQAMANQWGRGRLPMQTDLFR